MADTELLQALSAQFDRLYAELHAHMEKADKRWERMEPTVAVLESRSHLPADCPAIAPLNTRVNRLELAEARWGGMIAVVGVLAGLVAGGIITVLTRLVPWR